MALKELLTDLTSGLASYPNHNTPSDTGGFNYGGSSTRIFDLKTFRQKSFKFGEGTAFDQPGGSFSNMPYLYNGFLSADSLPDVPNPGDQSMISQVGDFVDSATDGLIRGGLITSIKRSGQDLLRIGKWMVDGPKGPIWLITQTGLQRSNPKIQEKPASFLGIDLGGNSRTYNPLGLTTLAQTLTSFSGLHINRAGLWPLGEKNYGVEIGYGVDSTNPSKYEAVAKSLGDIYMSGDFNTGAFKSNRLLHLWFHNIGSEEEKPVGNSVLFEYSGGPHSVYGLGKTTIKRYTYTGWDPDSKYMQLKEKGLAGPNYNAGLEEEGDDYTPYNITPKEGSDPYPQGKQGPFAENSVGADLDSRGNKVIYTNSDYDIHGKYTTHTNNITDFRKSNKKGYTDYQQTTSNGKKFIREQRVNLGDPGQLINKGIDDEGKIDYSVYSGATVDKINALDIIRTNGEFTDQRFRDLIRFRFEAVDTDQPSFANTMMFRAFLDDFGDMYNANYNTFKYNGRGEEFYTYNSFKRNINFSFKIAAQSRHEMMPLYRKLNYLVSNTAPEYKGTRMRGSFMRVTVGSYLDRTPGILNSVNIKWNRNYPWEISIDSPEEGKDKDMLVLPHVLEVSCKFTPIHNFLPQKSITDSPFILPHHNNRKLNAGQKWYNAGAAGAEWDKSSKTFTHKGTQKALEEAGLLETLKRVNPNTVLPKEYVEHIPNEDGNRETKVEEETTETNTAEAQGAGGGDGGTNQEESLQNKERKIPEPVKQKGADDGEQETSNTNSKPPNEEEEGKIAIQYEYEYVDIPEHNEAEVWLTNNAGYPKAGQGYSNVKSQGGETEIIKNFKFKMEVMSGVVIDGVYFPKQGTEVGPFKGKQTEVTQGIWLHGSNN